MSAKEAERTDWASLTRAEKVAEIHRLRALGLTSREAAAEHGVSLGAIRNLINDPDGSKQTERRERYRGTCGTCGARTDGSGGYAAPTECRRCMARRTHEERHWTQERILAAVARFVEQNGRKPLATDWLQSLAGTGFPPTSLVLREFGSWNQMLAAAGLPAEAPGKHKRTAETLAKASASQRRRRRDYIRDWGEMRQAGPFNLASEQIDALRTMNGCSFSEHIRRAVDVYLVLGGSDESSVARRFSTTPEAPPE